MIDRTVKNIKKYFRKNKTLEKILKAKISE